MKKLQHNFFFTIKIEEHEIKNSHSLITGTHVYSLQIVVTFARSMNDWQIFIDLEEVQLIDD